MLWSNLHLLHRSSKTDKSSWKWDTNAFCFQDVAQSIWRKASLGGECCLTGPQVFRVTGSSCQHWAPGLSAGGTHVCFNILSFVCMWQMGTLPTQDYFKQIGQLAVFWLGWRTAPSLWRWWLQGGILKGEASFVLPTQSQASTGRYLHHHSCQVGFCFYLDLLIEFTHCYLLEISVLCGNFQADQVLFLPQHTWPVNTEALSPEGWADTAGQVQIQLSFSPLDWCVLAISILWGIPLPYYRLRRALKWFF